jgi:hypothetical protein
MKYAVAIKYKPSFKKTASGIQKFMGGDSQNVNGMSLL